MITWILALTVVGFTSSAEEKTCALKGMDCQGCVDTVKEKVCSDAYEVCDVAIKSKAKKMGELRLKTKDATAKIDEKAVQELIKDTTYTVEKCKAAKS